MIDIHCHILPDFDDGAADLDEALTMAQMAASSSIRGIIATPHFRGEAESLMLLPKIVSRFQRLSRAIANEGIPLTLYPGAEILCLPQTPLLARQKQLPTLANTNYVLAEFYFDESPEYMSDILDSLQESGYRVVVAHPERYSAVQKDRMLADRWVRQGYGLQLNKGSILGAFGERPQTAALDLLQNGMAHLIASDAHSMLHRTPDMSRLYQYLRKRCPGEYSMLLLRENPQRLIRGEDLLTPRNL